MPEEQNLPELIQEDALEMPAPRSSESLPSANPACYASPPQPPNLPVAPETSPQSEQLEQASSNVQSSAADQTPNRDVEMDLLSSSPSSAQSATPPHQAGLEELPCKNPDVQPSFPQAQSLQYSCKAPTTNPRNEYLDESHPRLHSSGSMDEFGVILEDLSPPNPIPQQHSQEPQLQHSPSEKQYPRRSHVRIEKKPRSLRHTLAFYLAFATTIACGCVFGCIAYCFAMDAENAFNADKTSKARHLLRASYGFSVSGIAVGVTIIVVLLSVYLTRVTDHVSQNATDVVNTSTTCCFGNLNLSGV